MKITLFTQTYSSDLPYHVEENLESYKDPAHDWFSNADTIETGYEIPDDLCDQMCNCYNQEDGKFIPDGNSYSRYDGEAAKKLFLAFKDITPVVAAQKNLWVTLSHTVLMPYMRKRWPKIDEDGFDQPSYIKDHWMNPTTIRNWLEGLYWQVKCSVAIDGDNYNFEYTDFFFSRQKLGNRGIAAAPYIVSNPTAVKGMLRFYKEFENDFLSPHFEEKTDRCIQIINQLGAIIEYGTFTEQDFYDELLSHKEELSKIVDRKEAKRQREAELAKQGLQLIEESKLRGKKKARRGFNLRRLLGSSSVEEDTD